MSDEIPLLNEKTREMRVEITRVRRKKPTIKKKNEKYEQLTARLRELNSEFKKESRAAIRQFLEAIREVNSVEQFWAKWKKTKFIYNDHIPIFESNKSKTYEENIEILARQFVKLAERAYQELAIKPNGPDIPSSRIVT